MSCDDKPFVSLNPSSSMLVMIVDGTPMPLADIGFVSTNNMSLYNVYYIPSLTFSLASVSKFYDFGYSITFSSTFYYTRDPYSIILSKVGLYSMIRLLMTILVTVEFTL